MRIKTFQGRSLEDVLPQIREELGPGAVVLGQRSKVQGGVAGFFGTKVIEVTAADRMPDDQQLIELEDKLADPDWSPTGETTGSPAGDPLGADLAARFTGAMKMGRRGGIDVVDDWDPKHDADLAQEYGRVLEHAASAGFSELDVPVAQASQPALAAAPAASATIDADVAAQARALAERTHLQMQASTERAERALQQQGLAPAPLAVQGYQGYAEPMPMPVTPAQERARTFAASVLDAPVQATADVTAPRGVDATAPRQADVDAALRGDLGFAPAQSAESQVEDAISAAVEMIDLKAMAALRNAVHASRRISDQYDARRASEVRGATGHPGNEAALGQVREVLTRAGVDDDVIDTAVELAHRHRLPFGGEQRIEHLLRSIIEETIEVSTGFPPLGRAHRMALVGGAGCGKTTIVAKVAQSYRNAGMQVGVISIVGADPNVAVVGDQRLQAVDADVRYAATPEQAAQAAEAFEQHDLVIVDTPGATYMDRGTYAQVQACLDALGVDDVHVVVPLATSSREARSLVDAFRPLGANRLIVSRLDESRYIGQLLNFGFRLGVPMTFLSEGRRIPEDIRAASSREIAERILPHQDEPGERLDERTPAP